MNLIFKNKKAQESGIGMSFGWIFALILIVIFIVVAIYGIMHFIEIGNCSRIGLFYETLQQKVDNAYTASSYSDEMTIDLPGIKRICFANLSAVVTGSITDYDAISLFDVYNANVFLIPPEKSCNMAYKTIKHLNISEIIKLKNPYCLDAQNDKITIKRDYTDRAVTLK